MTRGKIILGTKTQCEMDELLWSIVWQLFLPCAARNATTYSKMAPFFQVTKTEAQKNMWCCTFVGTVVRTGNDSFSSL